ncbi:hypothetical protein Ahy_A09g043846 [Arachis hypogaea]|uniref:Uncharacterized protein n=1 Tax=Arachis hypogaea TaxID=3818 RepID=A0A445BJ43_ARAHY|nr:hypothetical protein Ahy_A09g043846 [Arachis hypogaea]
MKQFLLNCSWVKPDIALEEGRAEFLLPLVLGIKLCSALVGGRAVLLFKLEPTFASNFLANVGLTNQHPGEQKFAPTFASNFLANVGTINNTPWRAKVCANGVAQPNIENHHHNEFVMEAVIIINNMPVDNTECFRKYGDKTENRDTLVPASSGVATAGHFHSAFLSPEFLLCYLTQVLRHETGKGITNQGRSRGRGRVFASTTGNSGSSPSTLTTMVTSQVVGGLD